MPTPKPQSTNPRPGGPHGGDGPDPKVLKKIAAEFEKLSSLFSELATPPKKGGSGSSGGSS
jgi:hypothetical protein